MIFLINYKRNNQQLDIRLVQKTFILIPVNIKYSKIYYNLKQIKACSTI